MMSDAIRRMGLCWTRRTGLLAIVLSGAAIAAIACGGDNGAAPVSDLVRSFWAVRLNAHAINLALTAPYDTVQLTATPVTVDGTPLSGVGQIQYSAGDSSLTVSASGLVTAHYTTNSTFLIATLTVGNLTLADTAVVQVTATAPSSSLATFSIHPVAPDSAKAAVNVPKTATVTVFGNGDVPFPPVVAYFTSSDPTIATIDRTTGAITGTRIGDVTILATTYAYGVARSDSITFHVGAPLQAIIQVKSHTPIGTDSTILYFSPASIVVGVGAEVDWGNSLPQPIDVTFDHPENVAAQGFFGVFPPTGSGNIDAWAFPPGGSFLDVYRARGFHVAGTYAYHSTLTGASGTIIVQ